MAEGRISLDNWIAQATAALAGKDRQRHAIFQKEWVDGHLSNALLFPLEQGPADWQSDFDWYWTVEDFIPPEQPKEESPLKPVDQPAAKPQVPEKPVKKKKVTPDQAETVILNPDSPDDSQMDLELGDMETMEWEKK
jgi:hypothetical protein